MKRIILMLVLIGILSAFKNENPKVLLFIQDNSLDLGFMLTHEVGAMNKLLEQSGYEVVIATITGETLVADSTIVKPDIRLSKVNINEYSGFILPCMAADDTIVTPGEKIFIKEVVDQGKPLAAQTGAVLILAKAGALNGKKYAFMEFDIENPDLLPDFRGGLYSGIGVVQDGNIITSGTCPMTAKMTGKKDGTAELTQKLIQAMKQKAGD